MIIIKGMEMPTGCSVCELAQWDGETDVCPFCGDVRSFSERHDNCPLHELPPHGDLIDRDALINVMSLSKDYHAQNCREETLLERFIRHVKEAPVIVPAERRERHD